MKLSDFIYDLPDGLLAEKPSIDREDCRLMVLDRSNQSISHHTFKDIIKNRLKVYHEKTAPLLSYYKDEIINIKAEGGTPEEIAKSIINKVQ